MKKFIRNILSVLIVVFSVFAITSCDAARNTKKPTGSLNLTSTYASLNSTGEKVTVGEMYNLFRNSGYSSVLTEIKKQVMQKEMAKISYAEYKEDFDEMILNAIFGTYEVEDFEDIELDDRKISVQKFIDNQLSSNGIDYSTEYSNYPNRFLPTISDGEFVCNWPTSLIENYKYSIAVTEYAREYIKTVINKETVINVDGVKVSNTYYIDADRLESAYTSNQAYTTYADLFGVKYSNQSADLDYANHAIVVKYASSAQAKKYIEKTTAKLGYSLNDNLTNEQVIDYYMDLYNTFYKDKETVTGGNLYTNENTSFTIDEDENQFTSTLGASVVSFLTDNLVDLEGTEEGKSYLTSPFNLAGDNNYYMALRLNVYEGKDYDKLSDSELAIINPVLTDSLVDSMATESAGNTLVENRLKSGNFSLKIYDPVYENQYANSYSDYYDFSKKFNNNLVFTFSFTYEDDAIEFAGQTITGEYTVDDSYAYLNSIYGVSKATTLLATKYLLNSSVITADIDSDTVDGYNEGLKDTIKSFKRNETNYSKKMGIENYLVLQYGYETQKEVVDYKFKASDVTSLFNSFYGYFNGDTIAETNQVAGGKIAFKDNGLIAALKTFTDKIYDNYYSLDIAHILISIDSDLDGNYEDPEDYMADLDATTLALFKNDLLTLADALVREAEVISTDRISALKYLATSFNNMGYKYVLVNEKYAGKTWADFTKNFEFQLTSEDLSTISNANGSSYVEEFTDEVISLYDTLTSTNYATIAENLEDDGFWKYNDTVAEKFGVDTTADVSTELTQTSYGWHMLYVYDMTEQTSCLFTEANDSTLSGTTSNENDPEEKYGTWEYQDIVVYKHDTDTTDDDEVVYASGYSDNEKPSIDQLFIYFIEYLNNGSVTSMRSSTVTAVSNYFSSVISRYTSSSFQTYRLYKQLGAITFADAGYDQRYALSLEITERSIDSYKTLETSDDFYGWFDVDWTVKGLR